MSSDKPNDSKCTGQTVCHVGICLIVFFVKSSFRQLDLYPFFFLGGGETILHILWPLVYFLKLKPFNLIHARLVQVAAPMIAISHQLLGWGDVHLCSGPAGRCWAAMNHPKIMMLLTATTDKRQKRTLAANSWSSWRMKVLCKSWWSFLSTWLKPSSSQSLWPFTPFAFNSSHAWARARSGRTVRQPDRCKVLGGHCRWTRHWPNRNIPWWLRLAAWISLARWRI